MEIGFMYLVKNIYFFYSQLSRVKETGLLLQPIVLLRYCWLLFDVM